MKILALLGAAIALLEGVVLVHVRPAAGVWLFAVSALLQAVSLSGAVVLMGYEVYLLDGMSVVLAIVVVLRLSRGSVKVSLSVGLLILLLLVALARGEYAFGPQVAVNSGRSLLYLLVGVTYASVCLKGDECWRTLQRVWQALGISLVVLGCVFLARNGLGTYASDGERALNAPQALIVGQVAVLGLGKMGDRKQRVLVVACLGILLASQQRTVWAATIASLVVVAVRSGKLGNREATRSIRVGMVSGLVLVVGTLVLGPSELQQSVGQATSSASADSGTLAWRIDGWRQLLSGYSKRPIEDRLFGQPSGAGFDRIVNGGVVTVSPHNMYIMVLLSLGILGITTFCLLFRKALLRSARSSLPLFALICGLALFSVAYQLAPEQGLVLGAALSMAAGRRDDAPPAMNRVAPTRVSVT